VTHDVSYFATQTESRGDFLDYLVWFSIKSDEFPNDTVNQRNLNIYFEHMLKCVDRYVKDARAKVVMKEKIDEAWELMRGGKRDNAVTVLQQAGWVIERPDLVPELHQRDH
jgi:hypothetical protein